MRFELYGPEALSAYKLLAIILGWGIRGESVLLMAQRVLRTFRNLKELSQASIEELTRVKGIGLARIVSSTVRNLDPCIEFIDFI